MQEDALSQLKIKKSKVTTKCVFEAPQELPLNLNALKALKNWKKYSYFITNY